MSYYPTIEEDLQRAREILARGASGFPPRLSLPVPVPTPDTVGTIYGADTYAAYKLLESFVAEIEQLQEDLVELAVTSHRTEEKLRAEVSSPARPPLAKIALADDIIEQVQRHYTGSGPLPTKGSTTVYADAQMVLAALAEGAVSAAPQTHSLSCPANGQNLDGYRCECGEVSAAPSDPRDADIARLRRELERASRRD